MINQPEHGDSPTHQGPPLPSGPRAWWRRWRLWWRYRLRAFRYSPRIRRLRLIRAPEDTSPIGAGPQLRVGRLLGRGYLGALKFGEHVRIQRARLPERVEPGRVVAVLVRRQRGLLVTLVLLVVLGMAVDVLAHEYARNIENALGIRHWLTHNISLPNTETLRVLLAATAGATGTILGIVLSITLIVFQTTAERYGSARIVSFLLRERVGSAVIRLLALSFAYSLAVLVLLEVATKASPPYFSSGLALAMSTAGVLALITYRTHALLGYLPSSIADALTHEMMQAIAHARQRHARRSVQHRAQQLVIEDMQTMVDLLRRLISPDRDVIGVASVTRAASQLLSHYLVVKRHIAERSEWWEREAVRADSPLTRMTEQLATKGLMDPTSQQPNRQWLERRILTLVAEVVDSGLVAESDVGEAVAGLLISNVQIAFHMQEFDVCLGVLNELQRLSATDVALSDSTLAEQLTQVTWLLFNLLDTGIGFSAKRVVNAQPWRHDIDQLGLAWLEREEAANIAVKIERERAITGKVLTPHEAQINEVSINFAPKEAEIRSRLTDEAYMWLHDRLKQAVDGSAPTAGVVAKQVVRALLRAVYRELPIRIANDLSQLLAKAFDDTEDATLRADVREDTALLARNLAEAGHWKECWSVVHAAAVLNMLERQRETDQQKQVELAFDLLFTLAHVYGWAELTGEPRHVRRLVVYLQRPWHDLDALNTMVTKEEHFTTTFTLQFVTGIKYQRWFQTLLIAASSLPPHYESVGPQHIAIERGKLHASSVFASWSMGENYDEVLVHLIGAGVALRQAERQHLVASLHALAEMREGEK
ncbi:MAG TPA: DUF2254 family protein [Solirubrobacteraceae bacterium]|nr:DUF2254 family protein [Solirubrobacteraceae bacterium]